MRVSKRWYFGWFALALLALATVAPLAWRSHGLAVARRFLPAVPDLTHQPAEFAATLRAADRTARLRPEDPAALAALGSLYHANNYAVEAKACWHRLAQLQPGEPRWTYYLADLAAGESDDAAVAADLARTVVLAPRYASAWLALADFDFKRGDADAAEKAYRRRLELDSADPYARLGVARIALQRGDRAAAKRELDNLLRDHGDFASAHNLYAELAAADGDAETAKRQRWFGVAAGRYRAAPDPWKEALRRFCFSVDQLLIWGDVDLQTKFGDRGKALFERSVKLAPNSSAAWQKLGECYLDAKDTANARDAFVRGWQLPGASELLGNELNEACIVLDRPADALQYMDEGLRRLPDSSILHNARGLALAALGRTDEAMVAFQTAIAKSANNPAPLANLGLALLQRRRTAEARRCFQRALQVQPGYPKALGAEARVALQERDFHSAEVLVVPYFEQFPGVREARLLMADYRLALALDADRRGDPVAADRICRAGLTEVPESAKLHEFLGLQHLQQGDLSIAANELEAAHRHDPSDAKCIGVLVTVYLRQRRLDAARELVRAALEDVRRRGDRASADYLDRLAARISGPYEGAAPPQ